MTAIEPARELNEFIKELVKIMDTGQNNPFALRKIENKAQSLLEKRVEPPEYCYMILGMTAAASGNLELTERYIRNALLLNSTDFVVQTNSASALTHVGNLREALSIAERLLELNPDDKRCVRCAISTADVALQFTKSIEFLKLHHKLAINDPAPTGKVKKLRPTREAASKHHLSDEDFLLRVEAAIEAVREKGFAVRRISTSNADDGTFIYHLHIDADSMTCAAINFDIADAIVSKFADTGSDLFSIISRPLPDYADFRLHEVLA